MRVLYVFQAEDGIRDHCVTGVQTCALPIYPKVAGVTCYVSRAKTGGIKGGLGLAEDRAEASISCVQTGPIQIPAPLKQQDEVFTERISLLFKRLRVVRMVDAQRNTLVYMTYSD